MLRNIGALGLFQHAQTAAHKLISALAFVIFVLTLGISDASAALSAACTALNRVVTSTYDQSSSASSFQAGEEIHVSFSDDGSDIGGAVISAGRVNFRAQNFSRIYFDHATNVAGAAGSKNYTVSSADLIASGLYVRVVVTSALSPVTISCSSVTAAAAPGAPTIDSVSSGDAQASVAFTAPASDGGAAISSYTATSSPGGFTGTGSASPITVAGLANGTSYTFTVTATNSAGTGPASAASGTATPVAALAAPVAGNATASVAANSSANAVTLALSGGTAASVAVATQATNGTATASGTSITYTPTAGFSGSDSFTYTATNVTGTSSAATVSVTVTAPTLAFSPAAGALTGGTVGTAYSQTLTASGGTASYSYALTSGALPAGLSLNTATGVISGTPTTAGTASFTVTATDAYGATAAAAYTVAVDPAALAAPVAGSATANVAANSSGNAVALSLSGGTAASVAVATQASNGTATASGASIAYTPTAGFSGTDSFTYTATNATGTSAPATVSVTVNAAVPGAPTIGAASAGDTQASVAFTAPVSDGGSAITSYTATSSPGGLTGTGSASPITVAGLANGTSYTFTVTATNSAGTGPASAASGTATPVAALASPVAGNATANVAANSSSNPVTLALSGGTAASVAVATQAANGTATASGTSITYTPAAGFSGSDSFTYTATNATGTSAPATVSVTVNAAAVVFSFTPPSGALPEAMAGEAYRQSITAQGGTGTRIFSLASGALPDGLVLNISTGELNGPLQTGTEGDYSFAIAITDGAGATNSAAYTLRVNIQAVAVIDKVITVAPGEVPGNVYLNAGATGGPFVRADIARVSPANAGTAEIIEGEVAALEAVRPRGFYLKFTPNPLFVGTARIDFTLTSALGISNTGMVSYTIAVDRKAVAEKADRSVRDFVSARQSLLSNHVAAPGLIDRRLASQARERVSFDIAPNGNGMGMTVATSTAQLDAARRADDPAYAGTPMPLFNVWFDGTLMAHKQGSSTSGSDDPLAIETGTGDDNGWGTFALLSAGVDYLVSDRLLVGVAVHSDRMTDPGEGTSVEGTGVLVGPYASFALSQSLYLDASLLYGQSWNTVDLGDFEGSFGTTRLMATTKLEGILSDGAWTLRPNLTLNYLTEDVDDYDVASAAASVAVKGFTEDDLRFSSGLTVGYLLTMPNGWTLAPQLGGSIGLSSANGSDAIGDGLFGTIEAGFTLAGEQGWALQAMGTMDLEREETQAIGGRVTLSIPF